MTDGFSLITKPARGGGGEEGIVSLFWVPPSPFSLPAWFTTLGTRVVMKSAIRMGAAAPIWILLAAAAERQQTQTGAHLSHCSRLLQHSSHYYKVCALSVSVCVRGLMYAGGRWWCSPWISYICPAGARPNPAHRMCQLAPIPYNVPTIHGVFRAMLRHNACQRALWRGAIGCGGISQCISCTITPHRRC